jgi:hypothetical protein
MVFFSSRHRRGAGLQYTWCRTPITLLTPLSASEWLIVCDSRRVFTSLASCKQARCCDSADWLRHTIASSSPTVQFVCWIALSRAGSKCEPVEEERNAQLEVEFVYKCGGRRFFFIKEMVDREQ